MKIPIEVVRVKDPDGVERMRIICSLQDVIKNASLSKKLVKIQNEYLDLVKEFKIQLAATQRSRENRANPLLKWMLGDIIFKFLKKVESRGFSLVNVAKSISEDVGISVSYLRYLLKFRTIYSNKETINEEICWDKYRELLDVSDPRIRRNLLNKMLSGEIKTREELRKSKRSAKLKNL